MHQLDLFAAPVAPSIPMAPTEHQPDRLAAQCVELGLASNHFLFDLNGVMVPYDFTLEGIWALPSRLFRHPFAHQHGRYQNDGQSRLMLRSPLLKPHPFVQHVEQLLGVEFTGTDTDSFGRPVDNPWWHAVDLIERDADAMLATRQFTTDADICRAVGFALRHRGITLPEARRILGAIASSEPIDRSRPFLMGEARNENNYPFLTDPSRCAETNSKGQEISVHWPINMFGGNHEAKAWAMVHGLEDRWFDYRGSYASWSDKGRARREGSALELAL